MMDQKTIVFLSPDAADAARFQHRYVNELTVLHIDNVGAMMALYQRPGGLAEVVINASPLESPLGIDLLLLMQTVREVGHPIFWLSTTILAHGDQHRLREAGVTTIMPPHINRKELLKHVFGISPAVEPASVSVYSFRHTPGKRLFDIMCASTALVLLSPLMLVAAILVRLESKGPVLYFSYRVGKGYKMFKFWKFRSMRPDADKLLASMKNLNQYAQPAAVAPAVTVLCAACAATTTRCQSQLVDTDGELICEKQYWQHKKINGEASFVKIANDPRITRIGRILRNTSIDELPQLFNVLRGDMSIVGNRPLPLYEAEKLMTDQFAARFIAPAGITGLWQVSKRGKCGDMSEAERKALDNEYAEHYSLKQDLLIILRTLPALFQKENV